MKMSMSSVVIGLVAGVVASGAVVAVAAVPDSTTGRITACYAKKGGAVRVINAENGARCRKDERTVAWNQRGPAGPRGATGQQGPTGTARAYAYVEDLGSGPNVPAGLSKGITSGMVTKARIADVEQAGVYCFELSALGSVTSAVVTPELNYNDANNSDKIATVKVLEDDDMGLGCASTTDMAVVISDVSDIAGGTPTNGRVNWFFYVVLN